jgi:hypothetical protein
LLVLVPVSVPVLGRQIGGEYGVFLRRTTWPSAARDLGVDAGALVDRERSASVAPDAIADAVSAPDIVALDRGLPVKLLDLVADGAARCRELLKPATSTT